MTAFGRFLNKKNYSPIGFEIGSAALRMVQLVRADAGVGMQAMVDVALRDADGEQEALAGTIRDLVREHRFRGKRVVSVLSGRDVDFLPMQISTGPEQAIEEKIYENARTRLSFDIADAVIDYLPIDPGPQEGEKNRRFLIVACRRSVVERHVHIVKSAGLRPVAIDIAPCALLRTLEMCGCAIQGQSIIIYLGDKGVLFVYLYNGSILAVRSYNRGYRHLVERLTAGLDIDRQSARRLLGDYGLSGNSVPCDDPGAPGTGGIAAVTREIIVPVFHELLGALNEFCTYCWGIVHDDALDRAFLTGKASRVRAMGAAVNRVLDADTHIVDPLQAVCADVPAGGHGAVAHGSVLCMPVGLALREWMS